MLCILIEIKGAFIEKNPNWGYSIVYKFEPLMALASLLTSSQKLILNEIHGPCVFLRYASEKVVANMYAHHSKSGFPVSRNFYVSRRVNKLRTDKEIENHFKFTTNCKRQMVRLKKN